MLRKASLQTRAQGVRHAHPRRRRDRAHSRFFKNFVSDTKCSTRNIVPSSSRNHFHVRHSRFWYVQMHKINVPIGGHTTEMIRMLEQVPKRYQPRMYILASSDSISEKKVEQLESSREYGTWKCVKIPRSRSVGQSYFTSIFSTLYALMYSVFIIFIDPPDVIICNGPGTCIPIVASAWILRIVGFKTIPVVYVESFARVKTLSLTGRLLYPIADSFIVQWDDLLKSYPRAICRGRLV